MIPGGPDIRPALGDPAEVAKTLAAEARTGVDVVRLVAGDPLSVDAVITEVNALAPHAACRSRSCPGLPATHRGADLRGPAARVRRTPWPTSAATWTGRRWPPRPAR